MERNASTLDEAKSLFADSDEPVICTKEGAEPETVNDLAGAEAYFAV